MEKTELIERRELLQINEKNNSKKNILLGVNIKQNTFKHIRNWHILQINSHFPNVFVNK